MKHTSNSWSKAKNQSTSHSLRLVLEPRMVFDGAVADTANVVADMLHVNTDAAHGLLANDTGEHLAVQNVSNGNLTMPVTGTFGNLTIQSNGSYDYTLNNAAQGMAKGQTGTDTFTYTMKNGADNSFTSTLTIAVTGVNDAPTAVADTNSIAKNAISITNNVLANDTDLDLIDTKTVSSITGGTIGTTLSGTYGNLTLKADGSYTYALDNSNATVKALSAGQSLTETFTYTMKDSANAESSSTLTITIDGANDVPAITSPASTVNTTTREIVFIEDNVSQAQLLAANTRLDLQTIILDSTRDGLTQISEALQGKTDLSAIHILSHGSQGALQLGNMTLDDAALQTRSADLAAIRASLASGGDLLLYGCDVAQGAMGINFIGHLAQATGADVAASSDSTGSAALDGNWVLEQQTGVIEAKVAFTDQLLASYGALLLAPDPSIVIPTPGTASINEDTSYTFSGFNVTYSGSAGSNFEAIVTVTNSVSGNLVDGSVPGAQLATQGNLTAINAFLNGLKFQDAANYNGIANIDVTINVYNGNYDTAHLVATNNAAFNITINLVNDAPTGTNNAITINEDTPHTFTATEFGFTDSIDANTLLAVKISSLPLHGTLSHNGAAVALNQYVSVTDINASQLVYTPALNANGNGYGNFTFQVQDNGGVLNGGVDLDPSAKTMTINVTPVNDAPTTVDASSSVDKNAVLTLSLVASDVDGSSDITSYKIDTIPANGVLKYGSTTIVAGDTITKAQATGMTFTPTTNYTGATAFTFEAIDAGGLHSNVSTVNITVNSINLPPVLVVPGAHAMNEDTSWTLSGLSLSDPDAGSAVVQATLSALHGNIDFISTTGLTVTAGTNNSHSVTVQGTIANINAALASSNLIYTPDANYPNATVAANDTITVVANDLGNTGGTPQTDTKTITVTVNPVPDAPVTSATTLAAVNEDTLDPAGATVSSLLSGHFSDADGNTLAGIAISADASNSAEGVWQYSDNNGNAWQALGSVSLGSALMLDSSAMLRFVPTANWNGSPGGLTIHAIDNSGSNGNNVSRTYSSTGSRLTTNVGSSTDIDATGATLSTSITAVADPFVYVNDSYLKVDEGGTAILTNTILKITNVEASAAQIVYTVTGNTFSNGVMQLDSAHNNTWLTTIITGTTFTQDDIDNGRIRYVHNGNEPSGTDQTLSYTVAEGGTSANRALTIKISPVNDVPVIYTPGDSAPDLSVLAANIQKGSSFIFSTSAIQIVDPDNTYEQLVFRLESLTTKGTLTYNNGAVSIGTVFSYANLSGLKYTHDNGVATSDSFSITLRDGAGGVVNTRIIHLTIGLPNHAPDGIGNLSTTIYEDPSVNNGTAITNFIGYSFSDIDVGASAIGIAIVGNTADPATQGQWQYSTDGTHWTAIGTVNDTSGALVVSITTLVRFVPVLNYNGNTDSLSIRALDNTYLGATSVSNGTETRVLLDVSSPGSSSAISGTINTLGMTVTAVNDDPTLVINTLALATGVSKTITAAQLAATDVDSLTITYRLESRPTYGWLTLTGTQLGVGSIFTQADIAANKLVYVNNNNSTTDGFYVTVRDGAYNVLLGRPGGIYDANNIIKPMLVPITIVNPVATPGNTGGSGSGYGTGFATVTGDNNSPLAVNDDVYTKINTAVTVWPSLLLTNDHGVGPLVITSVSNPDHGTVTINGDGTITFTPTAGFSGNGSFQYVMRDNNGTGTPETATVTVHVQDVNDPQGVYGTGSVSVPGVGGTPSAVNDDVYTETNTAVTVWPSLLLSNDNGAGSLVVTAVSNPGQGTVTINGDGTITFTPTAGYSGVGSFQYIMKDNNGTGTPVTATVTVHILGVNDPLSKNLPLVLDEGSTANITSALLKAPTADSIFTLSGTMPTNGTLYNNGSALVFGSTFTQADINADKISFAHNGGENFYSGFSFTLTDGSGNVLATSVFNIDATPINDTPTIAVSGAGTMGLGATYVFNSGSNVFISLADVDGSGDKTGVLAFQSTDAQLGFHVTALAAHGSLQYLISSTWTTITTGNMATTLISKTDLTNGNFRYLQDGTSNFHDSFQIAPDDSKIVATSGQLSIGTAITVSLNVIPSNLFPVLLTDTGLTVSKGKAIFEGETRIIHIADLMGTDPDNTDTQIQFRITTNVQYGQLLLNGNILGVGSAFTQDDLNNNRVSYKHDGLDSQTDHFDFRLSDGSGGNPGDNPDIVEPPGTFTIEIKPVNHTPTITVPRSLSDLGFNTPTSR